MHELPLVTENIQHNDSADCLETDLGVGQTCRPYSSRTEHRMELPCAGNNEGISHRASACRITRAKGDALNHQTGVGITKLPAPHPSDIVNQQAHIYQQSPQALSTEIKLNSGRVVHF